VSDVPGRCTVLHRGPEVIVTRADPVIRISADLLQQVSIQTERGEATHATLHGDVLTLRGDNRTVVYRIDYTDWDAADDSYRAEWPD
jgi:hypothetical protein